MSKLSGSLVGRWAGIDEFIQTVETGSFTSAAAQLGVSKSYVSKQVSQLEERLNARLLQRTTRQLTLTDIGELFYRQCVEMSEQYERLESDISELQQKPRGTLKLSLNSRFGVQHMAGAVAAFSRLHPELTVEVHSNFQEIDLVAGGYDLTIRYGELEDSSLYARKLGCYNLYLYASPAYWKANPPPETPDDLAVHNCAVMPERYWLLDIDGKGSCKIKVSGNWVSDNGATLLAAACEGIGIAQLPHFYAKKAVEAGKLVKLRQPWSCYQQTSWAVYPHNRHLSAKVGFFIDFLKTYMEEEWLPNPDIFVDKSSLI